MQTTDFNLAGFLPYELAVLSERVSKALSRAYTEHYGLTVADWRVMVHTANAGAVSVREIQRTVNLEKPRISRSVSKLEHLGYLAKGTNGDDRRLIVISLTPKGAEILDDILAKALVFERQLLETTTQNDLEQFRQFSARLLAQLDTIAGAP